ncbi:MFS transporter [Natronobacterium texcoconense]|uniref:Predicted arabinose efflux permease, MFS family n=1 Tax=Natronobacterium texcoconense TaxID=1095778 RepID=A0A1H1CL04_NATTX|nr:MFS transporter [Natronobacterium texcoconense]SDQ64905.1 Predicted arabinose efflux permease, MFS family [Natronobacterium texcoconense]
MNGNDRAIARFTMIGHATFHVYELTIPLFVVIWLDAFDVSPALLGTVVAVGYGLVGVGALPSGILADRYGSKRLVVLSMAGMGGGFALVSLAPNVAVLGVALVVWGAAASLYHPAGLSLITRGSQRQGTVLAYHGAAGNVGTALGPLAAAIALTVLEWRVVAVLFVLPAVIGVLAAYGLTFDETAGVEADDGARGAPDGGSSPDANGRIDGLGDLLEQTKLLFVGSFVIAFAIALIAGTYYRGVFTFLPDVLADLPVFEPAEIAGEEFEPSQYAYAGLLLIGAVGQYAGGKISDYRSPELAIVGAFVALIVVTLSFPVATQLGLAATLLACAALGFFVYLEVPIHQALIGTYAPADAHGLSFGYTYLGAFGIGAAGASIAGIVLTYGGTGLLFLVLTVFPTVGLLLGGYLAVKTRRS